MRFDPGLAGRGLTLNLTPSLGSAQQGAGPRPTARPRFAIFARRVHQPQPAYLQHLTRFADALTCGSGAGADGLALTHPSPLRRHENLLGLQRPHGTYPGR